MSLDPYNYEPPYPCGNAPSVITLYKNGTGQLTLDSLGDSGAVYKLYVYDQVKTDPIAELTTAANGSNPPVFDYDTALTEKEGLYKADMFLTDAAENPLARGDYYIEILVAGKRNVSGGLLTIEEFRRELWDECAKENFLIDRLEFTDYQAARAIERPVLDWNSTPPRTTQYTCSSFPYRAAWLNGAIAYALRSIAHWYRRNHLPYQSPAGAIDDMGKDAPYEQIAMSYLQLWKQDMAQLKYTEEVTNGGVSFL